ncbi:hypothetical protein ACH5RR_029311 [Cinchona calisaya]|uniref:Uncharacterized protein n=1 Tax=Cinchona calisaya TaxID=153742 RepID=A0ABD2YUU4_9GENT
MAMSSVKPTWTEEIIQSYEDDLECKELLTKLVIDSTTVQMVLLSIKLSYVEDWVKKCDVSQMNWSEHVPYPDFLQPLPFPTQAWSYISMYFVEKLPLSDGFDNIWVVVSSTLPTWEDNYSCSLLPEEVLKRRVIMRTQQLVIQ